MPKPFWGNILCGRSFYYAAPPAVFFYASLDGVVFNLILAGELFKGNLKDIDSGMFMRTKYRYFIVGVGATIDADSYLLEIESLVTKEYNNSKLR